MSETPDISKLTKRQRWAIGAFDGKGKQYSTRHMPKTMEGLCDIGLARLWVVDWYGRSFYALTDSGREALAKIIEEERGPESK